LLIEQLGLEGYGIYWILVETLRDQPEYKYPLALLPALARRFNTTTEKITTVVMKYGLFEVADNDFFFSDSLIRRMSILAIKRESQRAKALKRWHGDDATAMPQECHGNADAMPVKESKVKESTVEQSKEDTTLLSSNEDNCCEQIRNEQSENKKKRKQPVFEHESKPYKLAAKLEEMIHTNNPDAKQQTETNLQSWAYEFDKAMRIDKRKARNIYDVMFYSQNDIFWKSNILSAKKLRQEYDRLKLQMEESSNDRRT